MRNFLIALSFTGMVAYGASWYSLLVLHRDPSWLHIAVQFGSVAVSIGAAKLAERREREG